MKAILKVYSTLLLVTSLAVSANTFAGGDPLVKKTKTYNKSYPIGSGEKVSFDNRFGELKINTWDKNEVKVDVTITAEANTDDKAQKILDGIAIEDGKKDGGVYFKTNIGNNKNKDKTWDRGEKQSYTIDYIVYMPASNPLTAHNEFGATNMGDHNGEVSLVSKFGSLTAGKLANVKKITVEFGEATIGAISNGDLTVKFGKAKFDNVSGSIDGNFEFCDGVKLVVGNNVKNLTLNNNFGHLYLDLNTALSANFDISTHFGDMTNKSNFSIKEEKDDKDNHGPGFNRQFNGKAGNGAILVKVKSSFGEVTLGHNLPDNVTKEKKKDKKRTTSI